jgi:FlaA1/EpsC-like NDP-sugar epimerase
VLSEGGEIFMLDMGVPVRILDLAERMIRLSGLQVGIDVPIEITGIRPGEKLAEALGTPEEKVLSTAHPYINRLVPIRAPAETFSVELVQLEAATQCRDGRTVRSLLFSTAAPFAAEVGSEAEAEADRDEDADDLAWATADEQDRSPVAPPESTVNQVPA